MFNRSCLKALLMAGLFLPLTSCISSPSLTSIVITPSTYTITLAPNGYGGYWSYAATGYYTHPGHAAQTQVITDQVTWTSLAPIMVTINSSGVATPTGLATGNSQITASAPGFGGTIVSNASTFIVNAAAATSDVVSLTITPANSTAASAGQTVDFTVIGTTGTGSTITLTTLATWTSSNPSVATIGARTGVATTIGAGASAIVATYTNADGTAATGYTTLTVQ